MNESARKPFGILRVSNPATRKDLADRTWGGINTKTFSMNESYLPLYRWRRLMGSPRLQIIFHKRATKYRLLLRKMTYKDKGSYESSPPCTCYPPEITQKCISRDPIQPAPKKIFSKNDRSLLQKSPMKTTTFCKRDLSF